MPEIADVEVAPAEHVTEEYVVRLLFKFDADSPAEAVEMMIRELADNGLRMWHYRVEDRNGNLFFVTGHGETKTIDQVVGLPTRDDEEDEVEDNEEDGDDGTDGATES